MDTRLRLGTIAVLVALGAAACSTAGADPGDAGRTTLRLGYFPNVTHASAIVGVDRGLLADAIGDEVTLAPHTFNAGPDVVEAIVSGSLDASFIGPNPAINAFTRTNGEAIRIVAGATSGGAALVVRPGIGSAEQLAGTRLGTPQLGNTQDVALRAWLAEHGYETGLEGGGDVSILPQANGEILAGFLGGDLDGAWVPEPWVTRMVDEGGGTILVDERDLWPNGEFVTTHLIVATAFLEEHPDVVRGLLAGHVAATSWVNDNPAEAQRIVGAAISRITSAELPEGTLAKAWDSLTFTVDPIADSLGESAAHALELGLLESADLDGIYDLRLLNEVLAEAGLDPVDQP